MLTKISQVLHLDAEVVPGPDPPSRCLEHAVVSAIGRRARLQGRCRQLDLRVEAGEAQLEVAPCTGVMHAPHNLDVLLRHRPRSISRLWRSTAQTAWPES